LGLVFGLFDVNMHSSTALHRKEAGAALGRLEIPYVISPLCDKVLTGSDRERSGATSALVAVLNQTTDIPTAVAMLLARAAVGDVPVKTSLGACHDLAFVTTIRHLESWFCHFKLWFRHLKSWFRHARLVVGCQRGFFFS
jgi:hypothetical protein